MNAKAPSSEDKSNKPQRVMRPQEMPPSNQEIISTGQEAERVLLSPVINIAARALRESYFDRIAASAIDATAEREGLYMRIRVLEEVLAELAGFVQQANALTERERNLEEAAGAAWSSYLSGGA